MSAGWEKGSDTRWRNFRAFILRRDKYQCTIRGSKCTGKAPLAGGHVDHEIPLHLGGQKYDPDNARASCAACNTGRRVPPSAYEPAPRQISTW